MTVPQYAGTILRNLRRRSTANSPEMVLWSKTVLRNSHSCSLQYFLWAAGRGEMAVQGGNCRFYHKIPRKMPGKAKLFGKSTSCKRRENAV